MFIPKDRRFHVEPFQATERENWKGSQVATRNPRAYYFWHIELLFDALEFRLSQISEIIKCIEKFLNDGT